MYLVGVLVWVHDLIVDHSRVLQQNGVVEQSAAQIHHVRVALDIVPLVHVDRVALVVHYVEYPRPYFQKYAIRIFLEYFQGSERSGLG